MAAQDRQRKVWVLDTETKGTGAHVVPYEKTVKPPAREPELALIELNRPARRRQAEAEPPASMLFKVVDVMSSQVLGEGVEVRRAIELLEGAGSVLDVRISVWAPEVHRWRLLTLAQSKLLWSFRGRLGSPDAVAA